MDGGDGVVARPEAVRAGLTPTVELLEREHELRRIADAIAAPGGVLVVEGEAGIGKSALVAAAVEIGRAAGARVLTARGGVLERDFGHGVARQLFEAPLRGARPTERRRWLSGAAGLAAPVLGLPAPESAGGMDDRAFAAQHGLYWLAANLAAEDPLLLVVDDLQWSDLASLRWLVYLARRIEAMPLLVLAAWRTGEPDAPEELLAELAADRVVPEPLSLAATGALITRQLGRECDQGTAEACHRGTGGNPFLLAELAHALDEDTELPLDAAQVAALGGHAIGRHVHARLARLPRPAGEVAGAAAVLDGGTAPRQLAALTGLGFADVRAASDQLVGARILADTGTLEFVHPLVRTAIYDALSPAHRAAAHRRAADVLDTDGLVDRAAVHLLAAECAGDAGVVDRLAAAAERALARGAVEEAVVLLRRALEEPPPAAARHALLMQLAQAEFLAGDDAAIVSARAALDSAQDPDQHAVAALKLAGVLSLVDVPLETRPGDDTAAGTLGEALDVLTTTADALREAAPDHALRLDVERIVHSMLLPRLPPGLRRQVAALAAEVDAESLPAQTLRAVDACLGAVSGAMPADEAADAALAALRDGRLLADPSIEPTAVGFYWALQALRYSERLDEYAAWTARRWGLATRAGALLERYGGSAQQRAHIAWLRGELATAVDEARLALAGHDVLGYHFFTPAAVAPLVAALVELGQLDDADAVLADHGLAEGTTWSWFLLVPARVSLALARGDLERATDQLAGAPPEAARLPLRMAPSEVAVALATGRRDDALERAWAMLTAAEQFGAPGSLGVARRLVGQATGGDEGVEHLRAAIEPLERSPLCLELARALVELGAALRRLNRRLDARDPLRRGLDLAQRCGAEVLTAQAVDELRASGARPRRLVLSGLESLTASEVRVARLVAEGRSNPEVAQALFVTRATVETHLGSVFRKLGVTSRDQLPAALGV
jgi:DNA-binding CsgD family transcriptional regulator